MPWFSGARFLIHDRSFGIEPDAIPCSGLAVAPPSFVAFAPFVATSLFWPQEAQKAQCGGEPSTTDYADFTDSRSPFPSVPSLV